ncbi:MULTISPECIES: bifunctional phosphopantothenoylcysteine decarboxylase/phosphopantothenate--cysteine ligase CoaBC [unclassified Flavobacterium]|uniref:bifunctional phosphopantothenoylcysteine decarboxylase/phosphopantothenate--cysteine ligase CoaBC n=1 Tax=unclassified Flavobacterium TaxID=196869 RepID=UPI001F149329|nr:MULTISPECIES: bifunctional phosphopantothenoylcysteine decarboxylase/phosphopantothenate--cysteine ligase CoaBC [unclassified Flavobacterium]UMY64408.1 bifunctional phosphopantothenoylcysteine decarboxylase/phosphopantothenate--cysteine ligase CoaBC [Flavobacterium sp. HJ-32-4]
MSVLRGRNIILGVSGGIAAYKTAPLVRLLVKAGAQVRVVMTPAARDFVTPLTLSTLSKHPVYSDFYDQEDPGAGWHNHVELGLWGDLMLVAPATANTLSKMANGNCDNLLLAVYLSAKCPIYVAPAMDLDMYRHPSTLESFTALGRFGVTIIPAESGELASGLQGEGRMAEPENIVSFLERDIEGKLPLRGKKVLVTAGPTYEAIDPVRFIGNHASGKMGYDIAASALKQGAHVTLVSGPTHLSMTHPQLNLVRVTSARQMYEACSEAFPSADVFIAAAAVADYRPKFPADSKIKKAGDTLSIELEKTDDILASLGRRKEQQFVIGFALETDNEIEHAKQKIQKKNLDLIVLNSLRDEGAGFGKPTNKVTFIDADFRIEAMELKSKEEVADDIVEKVIQHFHA